MYGEISVTSSKNISAKKSVQIEKIDKLLQTIERQSGWKILEMIKSIREQHANTFSISKEKPNTFLFIRGGINDISVRLESTKGEIRVSIPNDSIDTLYPSR